MNKKLTLLLLVIFMQFSCRNDSEQRLADTVRDTKKKEVIFSAINKGWVFYDTPINTVSEATVASWKEWREFMEELSNKPQKTIGAFQKKAKALSTKVMALNNNVPSQFDTPQIRSRIATLITQVRMMDLYINLDRVSDKKVIELVTEINIELVSLQRQMDKIVEKSKIPLEDGESEFLKMMDTTRAIPSGTPELKPFPEDRNNLRNPNHARVE